MNKEDLKAGEYYCWNYDSYDINRLIINKVESLNENGIRVKHWISSSGTSYYNESDEGILCNKCTNIRLATPEEKHWLNKCIELNKFITKEETTKEEELKQPSKNASIEEILEYCKKKYPIGTIVKSKIKNFNKVFTITGIPDSKCYMQTDKIIVKHITGYFYLYNNKMGYAEIVEEPKEESPRKVKVELDSRAYSLDEISKVINANYEKEDALEIIKTIKSIK